MLMVALSKRPLGHFVLAESAAFMKADCVTSDTGDNFGPVELRHLRYFVAVAAALSFTKGAHKLHLSQPSLTRQIKDLEEAIGVPVLDRTKQGVNRTRPGATFLSTRSVCSPRARKLSSQPRVHCGLPARPPLKPEKNGRFTSWQHARHRRL